MIEPEKPLSEVGERALLEYLRQRIPLGEGVTVGVGDDTAVVETTAATLITTDTMVEGVHFLREWTPAHPAGAQGPLDQPLRHRRDGGAAALRHGLAVPAQAPALRLPGRPLRRAAGARGRGRREHRGRQPGLDRRPGRHRRDAGGPGRPRAAARRRPPGRPGRGDRHAGRGRRGGAPAAAGGPPGRRRAARGHRRLDALLGRGRAALPARAPRPGPAARPSAARSRSTTSCTPPWTSRTASRATC